MLLLEGTEPEKESMTVRLGLGSRTSRIDEIAHILTTAGSKDGQPYSKAGLSGLTGDLDLQQQDPMELMQVMGGGVRGARGRGQGGRALGGSL